MPLLRPEDRQQLKQVGHLSAAGLELAISIVIGTFAGKWLDGKLDTAPYLMLVGLVLGAIAGFRALFRTARNAMDSRDKERKDGQGAP
jgi:F0F1-type ATP synthase assembly protein I